LESGTSAVPYSKGDAEEPANSVSQLYQVDREQTVPVYQLLASLAS
jgi:hypothetical protein